MVALYRSRFTFLIAVLAVLLAGAGGMLPVTVVAQLFTPVSMVGEDPDAPCATSRLKVGDLESVDASIQTGVQRATEEAQRWQPDARLYTLRLGC